MRFFDCNAFFGSPSKRLLAPAPKVDDLLAEMDFCGVERALVWHITQHDVSPIVGNPLLAEAICDQPRLTGCWAILPTHTHELPRPDAFFSQMKAARIGAVRMFPSTHHFLANEVALGDWLAPMSERRIPLFVSLWRGMGWQDIYNLLADFPRLVCVICDHGCWGTDRYFRPLLARYPNVCVDTAQYLLDGGLESLVHDYGPERLLYGSGFPESYHGGMMLAIRHAKIADEAKEAIAGGNLERILGEAQL
jgi:predicted TIM-barrel fold metal-dependent hydrolase